MTKENLRIIREHALNTRIVAPNSVDAADKLRMLAYIFALEADLASAREVIAEAGAYGNAAARDWLAEHPSEAEK